MPSFTSTFRTRDAPLANNSFFIESKKFDQARVQAWGKRRTQVGTTSSPHHPNQLWTLTPDADHPNHFYIESVEHKHFRLCQLSGRSPDVTLSNGNLYHDQLWRFEKDSHGYYTISNRLFPSCFLAKWSCDDSDWGVVTIPSGHLPDECKWKLIPRFTATLQQLPLWQVDNTHSDDFKLKQLRYTVGITVSDASVFSQRRAFKHAIQLALNTACVGTFLSQSDVQRLSMELSNVESSTDVQSWSQCPSLIIAIPPRVKYSVSQLVCVFDSPIVGDCCKLLGNYETQESR